MTAADIQKQLDAAVAFLKKTTSSYPAMVKSYGSDWTKWPKTSSWYQALSSIASARANVAKLPRPPVASFTWKVK